MKLSKDLMKTKAEINFTENKVKIKTYKQTKNVYITKF